MKKFLQFSWEFLKNVKPGSIDQAIINYVIHNNLLPIPNILEIDNYSGSILTNGIFHRLNPIKISNGMILRGDGGVPDVVHQYDRQPSLIQLVNMLYREKNFQLDGHFTDTQSALEQMVYLTNIGQFNGALNFFLNYVFGKNNLHNYSNILIDLWKNILSAKILTSEIDILEISLQGTLVQVFSAGMSINQLFYLHSLTVYAIKSNHVVSPILKNFVYQRLINATTLFFQNSDFNNAEVCIDKIVELNFPLDQDFYMLQSEVYRKLKKKSESVVAYQKALEFD